MKSGSMVGLALGFGLTMVPYGALIPQSAGNPNGNSYLGQPGSTYDSAANPPSTNGVVTYNPNAPLPKPVDNTLGPSGSADPMPAR